MAAVRVVVLNYDGGAVTMRCLEALLCTERDGHVLEIVLVDNASKDDVVARVRAEHPEIRVVVNATNEGFARGCNVALDNLDTIDFVALINNDTIVEPGWLVPLVAAAQPDDVGAVCPKLLLNTWARVVRIDAAEPVGVRALAVDATDALPEARFDERFEPTMRAGARWTRRSGAAVWWPVDEGDVSEVVVELLAAGSAHADIGDGTTATSVTVDAGGTTVALRSVGRRRIINSAGCALYEGWTGGDRGFLEPDLGQFDAPAEVFAWSGGAVLLKAAYLRDVGVFDPTFFLYYEDFDLSWRGRSKGWRYVYEPASVVLHEHMHSSGANSEFHRFWNDRNRRLTLVKNAPAKVAVRVVVGAVVHSVRARRFGDLRIMRAVPHAMRERRRINGERTVGMTEIACWMTAK